MAQIILPVMDGKEVVRPTLLDPEVAPPPPNASIPGVRPAVALDNLGVPLAVPAAQLVPPPKSTQAAAHAANACLAKDILQTEGRAQVAQEVSQATPSLAQADQGFLGKETSEDPHRGNSQMLKDLALGAQASQCGLQPPREAADHASAFSAQAPGSFPR